MSTSSSCQEIKAQFYRLSLLYHPDRAPPGDAQDAAWRHEKFVQISKAYAILANEPRRREYDRENGITSPGMGGGASAAATVNRRGTLHHWRAGEDPLLWRRRGPCPKGDSNGPAPNHGRRVMDETIGRWSRWAEISESQKETVRRSHLANEEREGRESLVAQERLLALILAITIYLVTSHHQV